MQKAITEERMFMLRTGKAYFHTKARAKKAGKTLEYSIDELRKEVRRQLTDRTCPYCFREINATTFSVDHRRPLCREGSHKIDNITVCCLLCNQAKGSLTEQEYTDLMAVIRQWPEIIQKTTLRRLRAGGPVIRS